MNDIYKLINKIELDLSEYENEELSELEKKKIIKRFKKSKKNNINFIKVAVAVLAFVCTTQFIVGTDIVEAGIEKIKNTITSMLINKDSINYQEYINVVGKVVESNGIKVKLKEFAIHDDYIILNTNVNKLGVIEPKFKIYINGEQLIDIDKGYGNHFTENQDGSSDIVSTYYIKDFDLNKDLNVKVEFEGFGVRDNDNILNGDWGFEFFVNGKELMKNTIRKNINEAIYYNNKVKCKISEVVVSPIGVSIVGTRDKEIMDDNSTNYSYIVKDDKGRVFEYSESRGKQYSGDFKDIRLFDMGDVNYITITPVIEESKSDEKDNKIILEENKITINIK